MARAKGYRNYYEYRTLYDSGRRAPGAPPIPRGQRAETRGHVGQLRAFVNSLQPGDEIWCDITAVQVDRQGVYRLIEKTVIPADLGPHRDYRIENITRARLITLIDEEYAKGIHFPVQPSLDQQRLVSDDEREGGY